MLSRGKVKCLIKVHALMLEAAAYDASYAMTVVKVGVRQLHKNPTAFFNRNYSIGFEGKSGIVEIVYISE